jgi:hypothetical protein
LQGLCFSRWSVAGSWINPIYFYRMRSFTGFINLPLSTQTVSRGGVNRTVERTLLMNTAGTEEAHQIITDYRVPSSKEFI